MINEVAQGIVTGSEVVTRVDSLVKEMDNLVSKFSV